ncbi:MAG: YqgE/AlgH family protein [Alphaproteobacteria bacterium]|nr:YqgE/AlgH family protein [Alphaproteobacteria bacterium]MBO4643012.1 YqgE/AlgH family protein [Alphaproteobacteria bacterium]
MSFLNGQCLVAMPGLQDDRFDRSVVYICAHTKEGAMGLMINRPIRDLTFSALLAQLNIEQPTSLTAPPILAGGPIDVIRGFVLHSPEYTSTATLTMTQITSLTVTTDVIRDISKGVGPKNFLITLGYVGWSGGQLEQEIKENAWLPVETSTDLLFTLAPEKKWDFALKKIGIDPLLLSSEQGKA